MTVEVEASLPTITPPDSGYGWVVVAVCFFNYVSDLILSTSFSVLYKEYMDEFDADVVLVGTAAAYHSIALHIAGFLSSSLLHRKDMRVVAMCGALVASISCFLASFSTNITMLTVGYTLSGAGFGVMYVSVSPVVQQYFTKKRTLVSGITVAGFSISTFVFPPCTRYAVDHLGWRGTLVLYSTIFMQNVWLCALYRPFLKPLHLPDDKNCSFTCSSKCWIYLRQLVPIDLIKKPSYLLFSFTSFTVNMNFSVYNFHIVNKCLSEGIDKYKAAFVPSVGGLTNAVLGPLFGVLASTPALRRNKLILHSLTATGLGLFLIVIGAARTLETIMVIVGFLSLSVVSFTTIQQPALVDLVGIEKLARGLGLLMVFSGLGQFIGTPLAGYLYRVSGSYTLPYFVTGGLGIFGGLMSLLVIPLSRKKVLQKTAGPVVKNRIRLTPPDQAEQLGGAEF